MFLVQYSKYWQWTGNTGRMAWYRRMAWYVYLRILVLGEVGIFQGFSDFLTLRVGLAQVAYSCVTIWMTLWRKKFRAQTVFSWVQHTCTAHAQDATTAWNLPIPSTRILG